MEWRPQGQVLEEQLFQFLKIYFFWFSQSNTLLDIFDPVFMQEKLELLRVFIRKGENLDACEVTLKVSRQQEAEINMGRELLTHPANERSQIF